MPAAAGECRDRSHRPAGALDACPTFFEYCNHQTSSLLHVDRMRKERRKERSSDRRVDSLLVLAVLLKQGTSWSWL